MKDKLGKGISADAAAFMIIKLVTVCLGFAVTRLLSQYLTTHEYGTYAQIQLIASTISSLTILGMIDGVNFFFCNEKDGQKRESYIATMFSFQCIATTLVGSVVFGLRQMICAGLENPDAEKLMIFAVMLPLLQNLVSMLQILMVSVGKARMIAFRNLIVSLARFAAVLVVVTIVQNVAVILSVTVILDLLQISVFLLILRKNNCLIHWEKTDFHLARQILDYCVPMAIYIGINSLNRDCDKYMIALLTDTETLAVYTNASKPLPFDIIIMSFCTVLQPEITRRIAAKQYNWAASMYKVFLEIAYVSTGILCFAALTTAPQLMELIYSAKYISGLTVFCIYILVDLIRFASITMILTAAGKTRKLMLLSVITFGGNFLLNILLFFAMGIIGPAIATLITTFGLGLAVLQLSAAELEIGWSSLFDLKYLGVFIAENLVAMLLFIRLRQMLVRVGIPYFWILVLVCLLYGGCLLLLTGRRLIKNLRYVNGT